MYDISFIMILNFMNNDTICTHPSIIVMEIHPDGHIGETLPADLAGPAQTPRRNGAGPTVTLDGLALLSLPILITLLLP